MSASETIRFFFSDNINQKSSEILRFDEVSPAIEIWSHCINQSQSKLLHFKILLKQSLLKWNILWIRTSNNVRSCINHYNLSSYISSSRLGHSPSQSLKKTATKHSIFLSDNRSFDFIKIKCAIRVFVFHWVVAVIPIVKLEIVRGDKIKWLWTH